MGRQIQKIVKTNQTQRKTWDLPGIHNYPDLEPHVCTCRRLSIQSKTSLHIYWCTLIFYTFTYKVSFKSIESTLAQLLRALPPGGNTLRGKGKNHNTENDLCNNLGHQFYPYLYEMWVTVSEWSSPQRDISSQGKHLLRRTTYATSTSDQELKTTWTPETNK